MVNRFSLQVNMVYLFIYCHENMSRELPVTYLPSYYITDIVSVHLNHFIAQRFVTN